MFESMIKSISFALLANHWYAILSDYPGAVDNLEMVAGADKFLDSFGKPVINCIVSDEKPEMYDYELDAIVEEGGEPSGYYRYGNQSLWLCKVNKWFWGGKHPEKIYVKIV